MTESLIKENDSVVPNILTCFFEIKYIRLILNEKTSPENQKNIDREKKKNIFRDKNLVLLGSLLAK